MFFSEKKAMVILLDPKEPLEEVRAFLEDAVQHYPILPLPQIVERLTARRGSSGLAFAVSTFRKRTVLKLLPVLQEFQIPYTLFLEPQWIGTNRLPEEPRPIPEMDPLDFFGTWKEVLNQKKEGISFGYRASGGQIKEDLEFLRYQLGEPVPLLLSDGKGAPPCPWAELGITGGIKKGAIGWITKNTHPLEIPHWPIEKRKTEGALENLNPQIF